MYEAAASRYDAMPYRRAGCSGLALPQLSLGLWLDAVAELGVGTVVFSPLAQGLLTDRHLSGDVPADSRAAVGHFLKPAQLSDVCLSRARALDEIASGRGQSLAQLALCWVLRDERITSALIGASSPRQLEDNVAALSAPALTDEELAAIEPYAVDGTGRAPPRRA